MRPGVIVIGSGAAGLSAALAARAAGADVTVLEATSTLGGTTALSSGAVWVPNNHVEAAGRGRDCAEKAHRYLRSLAVGDVDPLLVNRFLDAGPRILRWLEGTSPLQWSPLPYPDCHSELPGGMEGGRSLEPCALQIEPILTHQLRPPLPWRLPAMLAELATGQVSLDVVNQRRRTGTVTGGQALVAALLIAARTAGVSFRTAARATRLVSDDGTVTGVDTRGQQLRGRVLLASGGFERDTGLVNAFLRMPVLRCVGAPGARGDGLRMAMSMGAALGNMSEAWWCPTTPDPDAEIDGEPLDRMLFAERARPGTLMVDRRGRRFINEAQNYNDVGRALHAFEPTEFCFERAPSWLIFDGIHRRDYTVGPVRRDASVPDWLPCGGTLAELADLIDVHAETLIQTVERFNAAAKDGLDPEFGRGTNAYDRAMGDPQATHPTLRPLTEPPFSALPVHAGLGGTKGGPRTDPHGRVLHVEGGVIRGLYAAGNVAASPFGFAYPGTGGTLGQALVFGALAGEAAAGD
ncbi:FAD-dependent oxidoreductase [Saccharopolyspora sp. ASAGF58]|uniref:FAD-dependent oxidoreductase n=1 Tax=Saccharopolyspora sp. ASAGF58 TaxID=2719023 RepID=UPI00143FD906|nr:FAD-dependent oxidoreductase [Saccharopolyspora sp. ASAGF58]QIZ35960.1 FAD-dependent oxidoreductase [Saccharopolyspora sp. ASAGF58]